MGLIAPALAGLALAALVAAGPALAGPVRVATYAPELTRKGPGLLLRDIRRGDAQALAAARVIARARPDVIVLTGLDWDYDGAALAAFADLVAAQGLDLPHRFAARPNAGLASGLDLDGDGRRGGPRDAQGYGNFLGEGGMAVLSRLPLGPVVDHSAALWRDLPGTLMPADTPAEVAAAQRLSSVAHWDVAVQTADGPLHLLAWSATPPAFEPRNTPRNHDEAVFWLSHLPDAPFVLLGKINLDAHDGGGLAQALAALGTVAQDPMPRAAYVPPQTGANASHGGDPALDTAFYGDRAPGHLRASTILPAHGLRVTGAGMIAADPATEAGRDAATASRHRLIWVDLALGADGPE